MDPDQTAPIGAVRSGSTLFVGKVSKTLQQTTKADEFCGVLRVKAGFIIEMVFGWLTDDGQALNAGLVFQGIQTKFL